MSTTKAIEQTEPTKKWPRLSEGLPYWLEIPARDLQKVKNFYATLFPSWEWMESEEPDRVAMYTIMRPETQYEDLVFTRSMIIAGGIVKIPENAGTNNQKSGSGFTIYYFVDSIEETEARVHELGGTTVLQKTPQGKSGWYMDVTDIEGNKFGLYELSPDILGQ